ncbi:hypothetical protein [Nocardioides sp. L-11A]|uniref:hypothetical protein n=1 Tax=Nocardioides sp. L-11A TaxID=3043848 RepID=UPI00249C0BC0|nr:hypothetical protein QJ852_02215 [Nocardioides sp. L-11A]
MTLQVGGSRPDRGSTLHISAKVFAGEVAEGWALLEESAVSGVSGWSVYGPGDFSESRLPVLEGDDHFREVSFEAAAGVLPGVLDLLDWGNGEFPLLMQAWVYKGARKWMPWEDSTKYGTDR